MKEECWKRKHKWQTFYDLPKILWVCCWNVWQDLRMGDFRLDRWECVFSWLWEGFENNKFSGAVRMGKAGIPGRSSCWFLVIKLQNVIVWGLWVIVEVEGLILNTGGAGKTVGEIWVNVLMLRVLADYIYVG